MLKTRRTYRFAEIGSKLKSLQKSNFFLRLSPKKNIIEVQTKKVSDFKRLLQPPLTKKEQFRMQHDENKPTAPSVLEQKEVREALEFLEKHASELRESSMSFAVPAEFSNGKAQKFIRDKILTEAKNLRERLSRHEEVR